MPCIRRSSKKDTKKSSNYFGSFQKISTFAPEFFAQVAELVDALDSKSSVLNRSAGSIPALGTLKIRKLDYV